MISSTRTNCNPQLLTQLSIGRLRSSARDVALTYTFQHIFTNIVLSAARADKYDKEVLRYKAREAERKSDETKSSMLEIP